MERICLAVEHQISKTTPEDLKILHRICFGNPGKVMFIICNSRLWKLHSWIL